MVIITCLYLALVYLLFFKFKLLPWNKISQGLTVLIGVIILTGFLVGLQGLTQVSVQGAITGRIVEIAPQVSGRVITAEAEPNIKVDEGQSCFRLTRCHSNRGLTNWKRGCNSHNEEIVG